LSVDPLTAGYPSWSPYPFAMNRVIDGVDLDGLEWENFMSKFLKPGDLRLNYPDFSDAQRQKYEIIVSNSKINFSDLKSTIKQKPHDWLTNSKATFNSPVDSEGNPSDFKEGTFIYIEIGYDVLGVDVDFNNGYVLVKSIFETENSLSFSFVTLEGHVEKGVIDFIVYKNEDNNFVFEISSFSEVNQGTANLLFESFARSEQQDSWKEVLSNFVNQLGGIEEQRNIEINATQDE